MGSVAARRGDAPISAFEKVAWDAGRAIVGIDEVGRGAWAGPVTVGAVVLDPDRLPAGARDSKQLSPARRVEIAATVRSTAIVGIGVATNEEIDTLGLSAALTTAARRALDAALSAPEAPLDPLVLVDGPHDLIRMNGIEVETLVRGDAVSISIAAASVVAKVDRDGFMESIAQTHAAYGFARNRGYASPEHLDALAKHGPCTLHRRSWAPIARLLQPTLDLPV